MTQLRLTTRSALSAALAVVGVATVTPAAGATEIDDVTATIEETRRQADNHSRTLKTIADEALALENNAMRARERLNAVQATADALQAVSRQHDDTLQGVTRAVSSSPTLGILADHAASSLSTMVSNVADTAQKARDAAANGAYQAADARAEVIALNIAKTIVDEKKAQVQRDVEQAHTTISNLENRKAQLEQAARSIIESPQILNSVAPALPKPVQQAVEGASSAVSAALSKVGAPYAWGGTGPYSFDCSGLMVWAYQQIGKTIPRTSQAQLAQGTPVSRANLMPGDIVAFYPGATHVGMYIGNGQVVHAADYGIPVQVVSVDSMPFAGAARF